MGTLYRAFLAVRFVGLENIPRTGAGLLASNHISVLDPIGVALGATAVGRTVRFLGASEVFERPVVGWGLRRIHQIPIRRGARDMAALEEVAAVIRTGALAGIFPEGHLGDATKLQPGRGGAARIALASGAPLIPAAIWGTQRRWPKSGLLLSPPLRPKVAIVFGPPIPSEGDPRDPKAVRDLTAALMGEIARVLEVAKGAADA